MSTLTRDNGPSTGGASTFRVGRFGWAGVIGSNISYGPTGLNGAASSIATIL